MTTIERGESFVMNTYKRFPIVLEHGEGLYVYDENGRKYLDFVAGIAVNTLGHGHPGLAKVISEQAGKMLHVSNLYWTQSQIDIAEKLVKNSCFGKAFFCNSGAEANEGALKITRKYAERHHPERYEIIAMNDSFHGRTMGALTATGQPKYKKGLDPLLPGVVHVDFNDFDALKKTVNEKTAGIMLEPIQAEGGIIPVNEEYLKKVRKLCDDNDILLIYDEVQCGMGRLGHLFAYQYYGVKPDMVSLAKGIAGGVPMGAMLATDKVAECFAPGDHAATFGGNPLAAAAACFIFDQLTETDLLDNVRKQGEYLTKKLMELKDRLPVVTDVRGAGLLQGLELGVEAGPVISDCIESGLLLVNAGTNVIRFVPALIVGKAEIDECAGILSKVLQK